MVMMAVIGLASYYLLRRVDARDTTDVIVRQDSSQNG